METKTDGGARTPAPARWTVEARRVEPAALVAVRGETLALEATFLDGGRPLALEGPFRLYWQAPGMGDAWWSAPAEAEGCAVRAALRTADCGGAGRVRGFIGQPGGILRAAFSLRVLPGPGPVPNELPLPARAVDFAEVEALNAPWPTRAEADAAYAGADDLAALDDRLRSDFHAACASRLAPEDVVPMGDGTATVAVIGGKEIKAPAAADPGHVAAVYASVSSNGGGRAGFSLLAPGGAAVASFVLDFDAARVTVRRAGANAGYDLDAPPGRDVFVGAFGGVGSVGAVSLTDGYTDVRVDGAAVPAGGSAALAGPAFVSVNLTYRCLLAGTPVLMADGTLRSVEAVRAGERVACVDPRTGRRAWDEVAAVSSGTGEAADVWTFDDGAQVRTVGRHRFWNADLGEWLYLEAWNMGERALRADGGAPRLVRRSRVEGPAPHATIFTRRFNNYFAGGLLAGNRRSVRLGEGTEG